MILTTVDPPSPAERLVRYYTVRACIDGFHPSDIAARAARGMQILRRIAWIDRAKPTGARLAASCLPPGSGHPHTLRAPRPGQGAPTQPKEHVCAALTLPTSPNCSAT